MDKCKQWFCQEWNNKIFRVLLISNFVIMILLGAEFVFFQYGVWKICRYLVLAGFMFFIAWIDKKTKLIPNKIIKVMLLVRSAILILEMISYPSEMMTLVLSSFMGGLIGGGLFLLCYMLTRGGIGMGDVKLFTAIGFFVGNRMIMPLIFCTVVVSAIVSIIQLVRKKTKLKDEIPFAPFAWVGTILAMALGM